MASSNHILLSWIALNNDPYQQVDGERVLGPTLGLLIGEASPYQGTFSDVVLFVRQTDEPPKPGRPTEEQVLRLLTTEINNLAPGVTVHPRTWKSNDPTDYTSIHAFLSDELPALRDQFPRQEWIVHISPGTPAMQTIWVLMGETGQIPGPFTLVKSFRPWERKDDRLAVPVRLEIDTLFKSIKKARPRQIADEGDEVFWNPTNFRSDRLKQLYEQAARIAQMNAPVLILGERGTGKTTLANWIRSSSPFRKKALDDQWPSIACGSYTSETMRSELLGHVKGAYTGAIADKPGLLRKADGDTLFLDEIGDIAPDLQRVLIRALEEKRFYPVGSETPVQSNFRLLAATNRPLPKLKEHLDADFLDRIGQFILRVPALREIPDDLPWLWHTVMAEALARSGAEDHFVPLDDGDHDHIISRLQQHNLPGNIRDLFRIANQIIAARLEFDESKAASSDEAIELGFTQLETSASPVETVSRALARCFAENTPADVVLMQLKNGTFAIKEHANAFTRYLAHEGHRFAKLHEIDLEEWSDYSARRLSTLRQEHREQRT